MNSYKAYQWIREARQEHFAEFIVTIDDKVILVIQFDGNLGDCRGFGNFSTIGKYQNNTHWKRIV